MMQADLNRVLPELDGRADVAFLSHTNLTPEQVQDIQRAMHASGLSFTEAALHLGLLTQDQIQKAIALTLTGLAQDRPSIVEVALRKVSSGREVVVRQGSPVTPGEKLAPGLDVISPRGEQLRALRTELLLLGDASRTATMIAVVSPSSADGRTQLAAELALSFAQLGKRTLLVDADMRRPNLQTLFDCHSEYGLADAIATNSLPYLHPVNDLPNMQFLSAGNTMQTNPLELLSDNRFAKIVHAWQESYSFVVLDTPPTSQYADALAVATLAGRALILSRAKHTTYKDLRAMMRRLASTQSRVLGAVLNQF